MQRSRYTELFLSESREHVGTINHLLLSLEADPGDRAAVEELFRAVHTLKGMSAAMGYQRAADVAHALEHLLEELRRGAIAVDAEITDALFQGVDALEQAIDGESGGAAEREEAERALARLEGLAGTAGEDPERGAGAADRVESPAVPPAAGATAPEAAGGRVLRATVMIQAATPLPAVRALLVLRRAAELGEVLGSEPGQEQLTAGKFDGTLAFRLRTDRDAEDVQAALRGAGDVAHLLLEEEAPGPTGDQAEGAEAAAAGRENEGPLVRIGQGRLDALVNQVGELVIARDRMRGLLESHPDAELADAADQMAALIGELRDQVMGVRMVPVGEVFDRFPRLVRDAARKLGRQVRFSVTGRDVELDRSMVHELGDLLVHLLRNAVDHGIEPPEERVAAGKPETGEVRLSAVRSNSQVVVRVEDDGRGIDREQVRRSAAAHGWLAEGRELSNEEAFHLITRPGFSTASQVTEVSGRGVGLDAVRTRTHALGGSLEVTSEAGRGSTFILRLPLSLAIVRALRVEVAGEVYAVPISAVVEVAEVERPGLVTTAEGREALELRDGTVPLVRLSELLAPGAAATLAPNAPVVVVEGEQGRVGLVVDSLRGQHEAVLKPFDAAEGTLPVFAGATLLADGQPALILDVPRLSAWLGRHPGEPILARSGNAS